MKSFGLGHYIRLYLQLLLRPYSFQAVKFGKQMNLADLEALGYRLMERWEHHDRAIRIPFEPQASIDRYHGYCFVLAGEQASGVPRAARIDQGQPAQGGDIP